MKLLQINVVANWGSTGRIAEQIGEEAMKRGWESYVAYGRWKKPSKSKLIKIGASWETGIHYLLTKYTDRHGLFSSWATLRFIHKIKQIKPDVVHLHNIHGYYINYRILFKYLQKANIPVVWTLHDCWSMTGHCAHFVGADCQKWQTQCYDCPLTRTYPRAKCDNSYKNYRLKRKMFTSLGDKLHLASVSKWLNSVVDKSFFAGSGVQQHVIYNGIDSSTFAPQTGISKSDLGLPNKHILLAVATSWSQSKGLFDLLKLADMLPEKYQIVLIGLPQEWIETLPKSVIARPRTDSVEELVNYYSVADVVLNLSRAETFGLTTVEGLACGTPSVVYNTTASPELITPQTGRIVEQGDLEGVVKAVEELCGEDREAIRKRCRDYAVAHFDKNDSYRRYIELYEKLTNNNI